MYETITLEMSVGTDFGCVWVKHTIKVALLSDDPTSRYREIEQIAQGFQGTLIGFEEG